MLHDAVDDGQAVIERRGRRGRSTASLESLQIHFYGGQRLPDFVMQISGELAAFLFLDMHELLKQSLKPFVRAAECFLRLFSIEV